MMRASNRNRETSKKSKHIPGLKFGFKKVVLHMAVSATSKGLYDSIHVLLIAVLRFLCLLSECLPVENAQLRFLKGLFLFSNALFFNIVRKSQPKCMMKNWQVQFCFHSTEFRTSLWTTNYFHTNTKLFFLPNVKFVLTKLKH